MSLLNTCNAMRLLEIGACAFVLVFGAEHVSAQQEGPLPSAAAVRAITTTVRQATGMQDPATSTARGSMGAEIARTKELLDSAAREGVEPGASLHLLRAQCQRLRDFAAQRSAARVDAGPAANELSALEAKVLGLTNELERIHEVADDVRRGALLAEFRARLRGNDPAPGDLSRQVRVRPSARNGVPETEPKTDDHVAR